MKIISDTLKKNIGNFILMFVCLVIETVSIMIITMYISNLTTLITTNLNGNIEIELVKRDLSKSTILLVVLDVVFAFSMIGACFFSTKISSKIGFDLRKEFYKKVMSFSMYEIDKYSISTLISRSTSDIQTLQILLSIVILSSIQAPFLIFFGVVGICGMKTGLEWFVAILLIFIIFFTIIIFKKVLPTVKNMQKKVDGVNRVAREGITGIQVLRAFCMEKWNELRNIKVNTDLCDVSIKSNKLIESIVPVFFFINNLAIVIVIWLGIYKVHDGLINLGSLMALVNLVQLVFMGFMMLSSIIILMPKTIAALNRIVEVFDEKNLVNNGKLKLEEKIESIKFENVDFKYSVDAGCVINDVSFEVKKGETIAFIGDAGSGKSTILKLILRFYDVLNGEIFINNKNIKEYDLSSIREKMGYVPQKAYLFSGNVRYNINFGASDSVDDEKINKALNLSISKEFIEKDDKKLDKNVSQGGNNFSGGQKQRLTIARALVDNKDVLIFDDSFSALDFKTDSMLRNNLKDISKNRIIFIVSQRVATVKNADKIAVIEKGKIVDIGTHDELLLKSEVYKEIVECQK